VLAPTYRFGDFELNALRFELRRNDRLLKLERIPMELLILLIEKDGQVVSRQEIIERLWGKDVFVDTEHGINTAIRKIRAALREDVERPRFIQTISGKGYRFVPETLDAKGNGITANSEKVSPSTEGVKSAKAEIGSFTTAARSRARWTWPAIGSALILAIALVALNVGSLRNPLFRRSQASPIHSIAVLPLTNLSGDSSQDYFADGMTDEVITMLAKNVPLRVVSRTSAMQYKGARRPVREIAEELGSDGILEGSVERSATRVHMTVQLIHAATDTHLWAESYDRDLGEAFSLPSEVSRSIATVLRSGTSSVARERRIDPEAHDAYLRGRYFWFNDDSSRSQEYYEKAIQLQPEYAAAWSGLADSYAVRAAAGTSPPKEAMEKAEYAAGKALALDDSISDAHKTRGALYLFHSWDWKRAEGEMRRAIEIDPYNADAHHGYSYILRVSQRLDEALLEQKRATELDPYSRPWTLGAAYIHMRQFDAAIKELRLRTEARPNDIFPHFVLSDAYWFKGKWKESQQELEEGLRLSGDQQGADAVHHAFERGGEQAVQEWQLKQLQKRARKRYVSPLDMAIQYARLKQERKALWFLEKAYNERSPWLIFLQNDPVFDFLHSDKEYQDLVKKIGLPPAF
jgi:TolB-like protein/DNA-binding winged helix-turn-helix (wHTH) protein